MEIALRQLFHICYETKGVVCLLCLGYHNFFICAFGFEAGLFFLFLFFTGAPVKPCVINVWFNS